MYEYRRRRRRSNWLLRFFAILLLLMGIPVGLEFAARAIADATGFADTLDGENSDEPELTRAYRLKFLSQAGMPFPSSRVNSELLAVRSPLLGYRLQPDLETAFWSTNDLGFRDNEPIPASKPEGEIRIVVVGGSAAFGQLSSSNEATFTEQLEAQLNQRVADQQSNPGQYQPDMLPFFADQVSVVLARPARIQEGRYRVINAAVPGYASGNELSLLVQEVFALEPDVTIVLNGYADALLPAGMAGVEVPGLDELAQPEVEVDLRDAAMEELRDWFDRLMLVRYFNHFFLQEQLEEQQQQSLQALNVLGLQGEMQLAEALPAEDAELNERVRRYRNHLLQMVRLNSGAGGLMFIGVQPEVTTRSETALTAAEREMLESLGETYSDRMGQIYPRLMAAAVDAAGTSANAEALSLTGLFDGFDGQAFQSPTSLTDEGNTVLAQRIYQAIEREFVIVPTPFDPRRAR